MREHDYLMLGDDTGEDDVDILKVNYHCKWLLKHVCSSVPFNTIHTNISIHIVVSIIVSRKYEILLQGVNSNNN